HPARATRRCPPVPGSPATRPTAQCGRAPGAAQRVMLTGGSVIGRSLTPPGFLSTTEIGFGGAFFTAPLKLVLVRQESTVVAGSCAPLRWPCASFPCPGGRGLRRACRRAVRAGRAFRGAGRSLRAGAGVAGLARGGSGGGEPVGARLAGDHLRDTEGGEPV